MLDIIFNPISNTGKSKKAYDYVIKTLDAKGIEYKTHPTQKSNHATEIVRELNKQPKTDLIVLGGDGTFNEVLNGIDNFETITLGFIPCGTGNDYVKAAGIPMDFSKSLDIILNNYSDYTDFIQLDDRRSLNCAGAGMDADVLVRFNTMKFWKGKIKYYMSLLDVLLHLKFHKVEITLDGKTEEKSVFLISVANGTCIGGGMPISPNSIINDGKFDVVIVNEIKPGKVLPLLLKFLKGKHINEPCTETYRTDEVIIKILDDGKPQVDGEVFDNKVLNCKLITKTLKIFCNESVKPELE